jgi:ABC-2 type transport system permease protein
MARIVWLARLVRPVRFVRRRDVVIAFRALVRKEIAVLFGSPVAYLVLTMVALLTAITFFEHLRLYNHELFLYSSSNMGGFESDTIPDYVNLRDTVFFPVMEQLGLLLLLPIPLVTMGVFARERSAGTDEFLLTSGLSPMQLVAGKFTVTFGFVALMMAVSFVYPVTAIVQGGIGLQHLLAVFIGLVLLGIGIASIGLVCSAATDSQIVAAATTVAVAYLFYDFGWTYGFVGTGTAVFLDVVSLHPHFGNFAEGLVRLGDLVYFGAFALVSASCVRFLLELRRIGA